MAGGTGGNMATVCQIDEPVKPITVGTPKAAAARAVSLISVAARLADEVRRDRPALQAVLFQQRVPSGQVAVLTQRPVDLEVVSPAGDLKPVVSPRAGQPADFLKRQVRPLPGEKGKRPRHQFFTLSHELPGAALRATASSTRCTASPSANDR